MTAAGADWQSSTRCLRYIGAGCTNHPIYHPTREIPGLEMTLMRILREDQDRAVTSRLVPGVKHRTTHGRETRGETRERPAVGPPTGAGGRRGERRLRRDFSMFYAEFEREGRLQSAERAVPTHVTKAITNLLSA
jgi:hypothetical protein